MEFNRGIHGLEQPFLKYQWSKHFYKESEQIKKVSPTKVYVWICKYFSFFVYSFSVYNVPYEYHLTISLFYGL